MAGVDRRIPGFLRIFQVVLIEVELRAVGVAEVAARDSRRRLRCLCQLAAHDIPVEDRVVRDRLITGFANLLVPSSGMSEWWRGIDIGGHPVQPQHLPHSRVMDTLQLTVIDDTTEKMVEQLALRCDHRAGENDRTAPDCGRAPHVDTGIFGAVEHTTEVGEMHRYFGDPGEACAMPESAAVR